MGSYAQATVDIERIQKMAGVKVRRDPATMTGTGSAVTDNLLLVQDLRIEKERNPDATAIITAAVIQAGRYSWVPYETQDAGAGNGTTYWDADTLVEVASAA